MGEGIQFLREALDSNLKPEAVLMTARGLREASDLAERAESMGVQVLRVSEEIMGLLTDTVTPQGMVTIAPFVHETFPPQRQLSGPLAFLDQIRDPGNLGTLIRAADAAGLAGLLVGRRSADPYNPKAVRASAGSILNLPIFIGLDPADALAGLKERGYRVVAAVPRAAVGYWEHPWEEDSVVLLGNEAWGIPADDRKLADDEVCVPVFGRAESLNVAVAAALIFYEIRRRHPRIMVGGRLKSGGEGSGDAAGSEDGRIGGGP
jgi:TrmH family RNA methyltransferase